jgi:hypothetical protein
MNWLLCASNVRVRARMHTHTALVTTASNDISLFFYSCPILAALTSSLVRARALTPCGKVYSLTLSQRIANGTATRLAHSTQQLN